MSSMENMNKAFVITGILSLGFLVAEECRGQELSLGNGTVSLGWHLTAEGWRLDNVLIEGAKGMVASQQHNVLYSSEKPSTDPLNPSAYGGEEDFPEAQYRYVMPSWREAISAVALNRAGQSCTFLPDEARIVGCDSVSFSYRGDTFDVKELWRVDSVGDICVTVSLRAKRAGWYSIASPSILTVDTRDVDCAVIPGALNGHEINSLFGHSYAYKWGIPAEPVVFRERSVTTLASILSSKSGWALSVTAEPGIAATPWAHGKCDLSRWRLGLSAMNRNRELTPTLYHPVLGEEDSFMDIGDVREFSFRYTLCRGKWWSVFNHVVNEIYDFRSSLALRTNRRSLTDRLDAIHRYVVNDSTSKWRRVIFEGDTIGAQEYLGGVYMAKKDAMKNADYGAMWMLGELTGDSVIIQERLPYALNFKVKQQDASDGFLSGASRGQYFLQSRRQFVEEWGPYTEPIATSYYMLMDLGNISLFEPENQDVKQLIRKAADRLLQWQGRDGQWVVAYNDKTHKRTFTDLKDFRPTFYGLLVAYRILGDKKYLDAAKQGADWLITHAVDSCQWLGVCGDTRFAPDFAIGQTAQALMDLYDVTQCHRYREAAIEVARFYATSVYTHPIATTQPVTLKGQSYPGWQISPSGLCYEHGGIIGSANLHGPILLASHAGMFVRMYGLTGERLFLDMARAAAIGRDAFVDDATGVASYYWTAMNRGAGPYPHHAWWQVGWIMDYLVAELELRSQGGISFPAGFITPKVGPQRTFAFAPGIIDGESARLFMRQGAVSTDNPNVEILLAKGERHLFIMLLNDLDVRQKVAFFTDAKILDNMNVRPRYEVDLAPFGLKTIKIPYER